jgi:diadenylate cyclase
MFPRLYFMQYVVQWQRIVDFVVLSTVIYWLLKWAKKTHALRLFVGIVSLVIVGSMASRLGMIITAWILHVVAIASTVFLVLIYHVEIRLALMRLDPLNRLIRPDPRGKISDRAIVPCTAFTLAGLRCGALIVLTGKDYLGNVLTGGITLGGSISREILEAIFRKDSPVHDGAVIIEGNQISRVGVFLPLTSREDLPNHYGARHRAAIGLAEASDAKVIVVSEERGEVTLVGGGEVRRMGSADQLAQEVQYSDRGSSRPIGQRLWCYLAGNLKLKASALGIASLIWGVVFMTGTSVRSFAVPIEFENVPAGLDISEPVNNVLTVQLGATAQLFDILDVSQLAVRVDLGGMSEGVHRITVQKDNLNLPPGFALERVMPAIFKLSLSRRVASGHDASPDSSSTLAKAGS